MISFYKSIVDQDRASIVICNLKHEIIYMNPAAVNSYAKRGGDKLIGRSLLDCHNQESRDKIQKTGLRQMRAITLSILSIMRSKIKMFIWWHSEKRED